MSEKEKLNTQANGENVSGLFRRGSTLFPSKMFRSGHHKQSKGTRLVAKNGRVNLRASNIPRKRERFLADFFTSLIDAKWRWFFSLFSLAFVSSWFFFGTVWFLVVWLRKKAGSEVVCVENVDSWTSAFLFSVETQTTIGYGGRQVTSECPESVIFLLLQSLSGLTLSASLLGLIFAKLSRPRPRTQTLIFSKKALIAMHNGKLSLMFRVGDLRKSQLVDVSISVHCFCFQITKEGPEVLVLQRELPVSIEHGVEAAEQISPFLLMPLTVVHAIDEGSPLYELGALELADSNMEIIAVLEGVVESTGMVVQAKASYLAGEILWGQRFHPISVMRSGNGRDLTVDLSTFDATYHVRIPSFSAKENEKLQEEELNGKECESAEISTREEAKMRELTNGCLENQVWIPMEQFRKPPSHRPCCHNYTSL